LEPENALAKAVEEKTRNRGEHRLSREQVLGFQSVKDWHNGLPEPKSKDTIAGYTWSMQVYADFTGKNPDELILERDKEQRSPSTLIQT